MSIGGEKPGAKRGVGGIGGHVGNKRGLDRQGIRPGSRKCAMLS